jgi:hypothetical protein
MKFPLATQDKLKTDQFEKKENNGGERNKKGQTEHRTATTAYPCYLPILGEFSRS